MGKKINRIISAINNIPGATAIPNSEEQNCNPPHITFSPFLGDEINIKKVWDGGGYDEDVRENVIDKIKPIISEPNILAEISINDSEELWGSSSVHGIEAIAWYKSFHVSNYWGIYISYSGLLRYAKKFNSAVGDEKTCLDLAWDGIMSHESVHYAVDVACARAELIAHLPIYLPGKVLTKSQHGYSIDEERLAEGALLRYFKSKKSHQNRALSNTDLSVYEIALRNSMRLPKGYAEGYQAATMLNFKGFADKYMSDLINYSLPRPSPAVFEILELSSLMPFRNYRGGYSPGYIDWSECPIYIVDDHQCMRVPGGLMSFLTSINHISESQKFVKKISPRYIDSWKITKTKLSDPIVSKSSTNIDLKRWPDEDDRANKTKAWSVRVGGKSANMRAHIDESTVTGIWVADRFGTADAMGHHKNR